MTDARFVIATAGHVDHGKTALVRALTGIDTDRLAEEQRRGITIDLGFAHLSLADAAGTVAVGLVDVPGHEDYVRNMVAGVGAVDAALLVVAADDGWMPQTEEHLQILEYQGVARAVVAVTKSDLTADVDSIVASVREKLRGSAFESAEIVPVSTRSGVGLDSLKAAMLRMLRSAPPAADHGAARLWVDRAFVLRGVGTVVTGTLLGGSVGAGQSLVARSTGRSVRVRGVQVHHDSVPSARPGSRVALNLADVDVADVGRGELLSTSPASPVTDASAVVWQSGRAELPPLQNLMRAWLHVGTRSTPVRLRLRPGGAVLRFESPQPVSVGDRFVLRDWQAKHTIGGGLVTSLNTRPMPAVTHTAGVDDLLRANLQAAGRVEVSTWAGASIFGSADVAEAAKRVEAVTAGGWLVASSRWAAAVAKVTDVIERTHLEHPQWRGCDLATVRAAVNEPEPVVDALLLAVAGRGYVRSGSVVARAGFRPELPAALRAAGARVRTALSAKPFEPDNRKSITPTPAEAAALKFLLDTGEAIAVGPELVMSADAVARAADLVRAHIRAAGPSSASDLRQAIGTTRRVIVPLLEYFDREKITVREGDLRRLSGRG